MYDFLLLTGHWERDYEEEAAGDALKIKRVMTIHPAYFADAVTGTCPTRRLVN
jgi:hypothetical protein